MKGKMVEVPDILFPVDYHNMNADGYITHGMPMVLDNTPNHVEPLVSPKTASVGAAKQGG